MIIKNYQKLLFLFHGMAKCKHSAAKRFDRFFEQAVKDE
jgi:hypothetical protein